ncbi:MAG: DUF2117 domain-containing protein [Archaeoglobaceae archaeon]
MKICLLVHGAEAFYSGEVAKVAEKLKNLGDIKIFVTGAISRTAAIDEKINLEFWKGLPSTLLKSNEKDFDVFILLTYSKSAVSGYTYAKTVLERSKIKKPVLQLEISNKTAKIWNSKNFDFKDVLELLRFELVDPDIEVKNFWKEGSREYRRVLAIEKGELLLIDGLVVGRAKDEDVVIVAENGKIVEIRGLELKRHGIEKLMKKHEKIDLEKIKVCSLRRFELKSVEAVKKKGFGVAFIDHSGYEVYDFAENCEGIVCVGDDTTFITSEILFRFGKPVLGIVDGDLDIVINKKNVHPISEIFITKHDDLAGEIVFKRVFCERNYVQQNFEEIRYKIMELLKSSGLLIQRRKLSEI